MRVKNTYEVDLMAYLDTSKLQQLAKKLKDKQNSQKPRENKKTN